MLKVENKSKEEITRIGRKIGEAFVAEKGGIATLLTEEQTVKAFEIISNSNSREWSNGRCFGNGFIGNGRK